MIQPGSVVLLLAGFVPPTQVLLPLQGVPKTAGKQEPQKQVIRELSIMDANAPRTRKCYGRGKLFNKVCKYIFLLYQPQDLLTGEAILTE